MQNAYFFSCSTLENGDNVVSKKGSFLLRMKITLANASISFIIAIDIVDNSNITSF